MTLILDAGAPLAYEHGDRTVRLTRERARRIGTLLSQAHRRDVIDASLIDAATDGDEILTSDPDDIAALAQHSGKNLIVTRV